MDAIGTRQLMSSVGSNCSIRPTTVAVQSHVGNSSQRQIVPLDLTGEDLSAQDGRWTSTGDVDWLPPRPAYRDVVLADFTHGQLDGGQFGGAQLGGGHLDSGQLGCGHLDCGQLEGGHLGGDQLDCGQLDCGQLDGGQLDSGPLGDGQLRQCWSARLWSAR